MEFGPHLVLALLEGAVTSAILALTAMGLSIVFGVMRIVNIAHGEFYMLGAVFAWWITYFFGGNLAIGFILALVLAPIIVAVIASLADRIILQRIDYNPERTIVATIGLLYIIQQLTLIYFGPDPRPVQPPFNHRINIPWFEFGESGFELVWPWGLGTTTYKLFIIAIAAVILVGIWKFITKSRFGLYMRATQQDRTMATAFGINTNKVFVYVFGLGAGLAALGAVLIVPVQQAHYLMGNDPLLLSFIIVIIGGLGSLPGTLVAALLIGMSDGIISVFFTPTLAKIFATCAVALVLVFRPQGIMGKSQL